MLLIVPPLHLRPPELPETVADPGLPPPVDGYDFILHVGLGARGGFCLEKRGRKEGYFIPDVEGKLAPILSEDVQSAIDVNAQGVLSEAVRFEAERANAGSGGSGPRNAVRRGFAEGYDKFPAELWSTLNIDKIVSHLKGTGLEVRTAYNVAHALRPIE